MYGACIATVKEVIIWQIITIITMSQPSLHKDIQKHDACVSTYRSGLATDLVVRLNG
jgi:hypothetical protein